MQGLLLILGSLLVASVAGATTGNYNSILIGDQAAGMGGAATAMAEDASGMAWYNPAGLALLPGQSFSSSVGVYKKYDTVYSDDTDIAAAGLRSNQGFFRAIPSSTASVIRPKQIPWLRGWTMALSIIVPTYDTYKGSVVDTKEDSSTLNVSDETLWTGGAFARQLSPDSSIGFSFYYTARSYSRSVTERTYDTADNTKFRIFTEELAYTQNALVGIIGYHQRLSDAWRLGISFRPRSLKVAGKGVYAQNDIENGTIKPPIAHSSVNPNAVIPTRINLGLAYVQSERYTLALDLNFYEGISYKDVNLEEYSENLEHRAITNVSLGAEYTWDTWLKFRAGVFTNLSAFPNPNPATVRSQGDHVDQAGFSANAAFITGPLAFTFGGYFTGGRGRSVQRVNHQYEVIPKIHNVFTMLVGSSYYF